MAAGSKHVTAALKLMDWLVSPARGKWEISNYQIPAFPVDTSGSTVSPLFQQVIKDTAGYSKGEGNVGFNIDVNETDVFNKAMWDGMQGVLSQKKTPAQLASDLQAAAKKSS
jgi:raffinose/stachyose/melibiose transport system substrate-binding protein